MFLENKKYSVAPVPLKISFERKTRIFYNLNNYFQTEADVFLHHCWNQM